MMPSIDSHPFGLEAITSPHVIRCYIAVRCDSGKPSIITVAQGQQYHVAGIELHL